MDNFPGLLLIYVIDFFPSQSRSIISEKGGGIKSDRVFKANKNGKCPMLWLSCRNVALRKKIIFPESYSSAASSDYAMHSTYQYTNFVFTL